MFDYIYLFIYFCLSYTQIKMGGNFPIVTDWLLQTDSVMVLCLWIPVRNDKTKSYLRNNMLTVSYLVHRFPSSTPNKQRLWLWRWVHLIWFDLIYFSERRHVTTRYSLFLTNNPRPNKLFTVLRILNKWGKLSAVEKIVH